MIVQSAELGLYVTAEMGGFCSSTDSGSTLSVDPFSSGVGGLLLIYCCPSDCLSLYLASQAFMSLLK